MKTDIGEWLDLVGEADLARAFPPRTSPEFAKTLKENWADTSFERPGGTSFSSFLARAFKSKRNCPDRFYIFVLWLCLCLDRPWNRGWRFSITEKMLGDVEDILYQNRIDPPRDLPDFSTLWKRLKQPDVKKNIIDAAFGPELHKLRLAIDHLAFPSAFGLPSAKDIFSGTKPRFVSLTRNGPISKRNLMRKLRASKLEVDQLIKWAGPRLKVEDRGRGSVWIQKA